MRVQLLYKAQFLYWPCYSVPCLHIFGGFIYFFFNDGRAQGYEYTSSQTLEDLLKTRPRLSRLAQNPPRLHLSLKMNSCRLCPNLTSNTMEVRKSATYHFITRLWCNRFNAHLSNWVQEFLGTANFKLAGFRKFAIDETLKELLGWI